MIDNQNLDSVEEQQKKRYDRSRDELLLLLERASDLEYDLNFYADYCNIEPLFEASKHAKSIYHLVRKGLIKKGEDLNV